MCCLLYIIAQNPNLFFKPGRQGGAYCRVSGAFSSLLLYQVALKLAQRIRSNFDDTRYV